MELTTSSKNDARFVQSLIASLILSHRSEFGPCLESSRCGCGHEDARHPIARLRVRTSKRTPGRMKSHQPIMHLTKIKTMTKSTACGCIQCQEEWQREEAARKNPDRANQAERKARDTGNTKEDQEELVGSRSRTSSRHEGVG